MRCELLRQSWAQKQRNLGEVISGNRLKRSNYGM